MTAIIHLQLPLVTFFLPAKAVHLFSKIATASAPFSHHCLSHSPCRASRAIPGCCFCLSLPGPHGFFHLHPQKPHHPLHHLLLLPSPCCLLFHPSLCYFYQGAKVSASSSSQRLFSSSAKSNSRRIPCTHTQLPKPERGFCRATPSAVPANLVSHRRATPALSRTGNADIAATASSIPPHVLPHCPLASPVLLQHHLAVGSPRAPSAAAGDKAEADLPLLPPGTPVLQDPQLSGSISLPGSTSLPEHRNPPPPYPLHFWFKFPAPYQITK